MEATPERLKEVQAAYDNAEVGFLYSDEKARRFLRETEEPLEVAIRDLTEGLRQFRMRMSSDLFLK